MIINKCVLPSFCLLLAGLAVFSATTFFSQSQAKQPQAQPSGASMTKAASEFVSSLTEDQRKEAMLKFESKQRTGWHFIPKDARKGLQFKSMMPKQRAAAKKLLAVSLSQVGLKKATTIMQLEGLLFAIEKGRGAIRDPERYYYTLFGSPDESGKWGLSIEGHHLSLNFVVANNKLISVSPSFFAANPGIVKTDVYDRIKKGTRVLKAEEEIAFELVNSLTAEQKKDAIFAAKAPREIRAAGEPQPPQDSAIGIAGKKLTDAQMKKLRKLVSSYTENFPESIESEKLAAIGRTGWDNVKFAWGGPTKPGIGHYYRIQGDSFLIEFVNTQPDAQGNPANHIHCVWRNPNGDFAIDLKK